MAYNFGGKIVQDGLILYLDAANRRSYPGAGTDWNDLTVNRNNGTLINGHTFSSANAGSIVFDGSNDYVSTNYTASLGDFTVGVWFKASNSLNGGYARLVDKDYASGFWIGKYETPNNWGGGVLESSPPYGRYVTLPDNQWNCIFSVRQDTTHTVYGNGITNNTSGTVSSAALNSTNISVASLAGVSNFLNGSISLLCVYNRALSAQEVLQNYNALKHRYGLT